MIPNETDSSRPPAAIRRPSLLLGLLLMTTLGCGAEDGDPGPGEPDELVQAQTHTLGPRDGLDLPPTDLDRVAVGLPAPGFSLRSLAGGTVTLSAFRGLKNVVLVFYRGHW